MKPSPSRRGPLPAPAYRGVACLLFLATMLLAGVANAQDAPPPVELDKTEKVEVKIVLIDVVILDRSGRTVPDLTIDDFEITADGKRHEIDTLDVSCAGGASDDVVGMHDPGNRRDVHSPEAPRKIVLAFDYLHMTSLQRADAFDNIKRAMRHGPASNTEIMVAALNGGLRVEQPFSRDRDQTYRTLRTMENDITLWNRNYVHVTEESFFVGLQTLIEVLGTYPGNKSLVLLSNHPGSASPEDARFAELIAAASGARCSIYTMDVNGLQAKGPG